MDHKQLRKAHPQLFRLWVESKKALKFGDSDPGPVPQKDKNYVLSVVNDKERCFTVIEYNDGWVSDTRDKKVQDINIPSREIISFQSQDISENNFISLLMDIIQIYSTEDLENQILACFRTNGAGRIAFNAVRNEVNALDLENIQFFPTARRSKYGGEELFSGIGKGWEMSVSEEKKCLDAMKTAQEQGYFTLATDNSRNMFQMTSVDYSEQKEIDSFMYVWMMLSFIRLSSMSLF